MKITKLSFPLATTAALIGLVACAVSCAKKNNGANNPLPPPTEPLPTNSVTDNTALGTNEIAPTLVNTNAAPDITNPPPAETTIKAPETPAPATNTLAATETNLPGHSTVIEMPVTTPVAPTNFYPTTIAGGTNACCLSPVACADGSTNYFLRFRAGYEHIYHGDNNDSYFVSAKFYAYGDGIREAVGKNGWLIPDASAEISSGYLPKTDHDAHQGSDQGVRFRADFTWPWFHWTTLMFGNSKSACPFCQPLALGLGPTVNVGFDHLYNESEYRFARYAGVRLTINRGGFIEYTAGGTDGLDGTRHQVVAELPIYESGDGEVRYYLRGLWNRGSSNKPDILEGGIYLEMPFSTLVTPSKWGDLVPFRK